MELIGRDKLIKLKKKNQGNALLAKAIDKLISDIEEASWKSKEEVKKTRKDADSIHSDGFFIFNIKVHRTMILIEYGSIETSSGEAESGEAEVIWVGSHDEYESTFNNNKHSIEKWLRSQGYIE